MARRKAKRGVIEADQQALAKKPGEDDLQVLHPNRVIEVAGRKLTVREYSFLEGLSLRPVVQPLLDDLAIVMSAGVPELDAVMGILGKHAELTIELAAKAADVEPEWLAGLSQDEGSLVLMFWWYVNGPFYIRCVTQRLQAERISAAVRAGQMSTVASSEQVMEHPKA